MDGGLSGRASRAAQGADGGRLRALVEIDRDRVCLGKAVVALVVVRLDVDESRVATARVRADQRRLKTSAEARLQIGAFDRELVADQLGDQPAARGTSNLA